MSRVRTRPTRDDTREKLFEAAARVFEEQGIGGASIEIDGGYEVTADTVLGEIATLVAAPALRSSQPPPASRAAPSIRISRARKN